MLSINLTRRLQRDLDRRRTDPAGSNLLLLLVPPVPLSTSACKSGRSVSLLIWFPSTDGLEKVERPISAEYKHTDLIKKPNKVIEVTDFDFN